MYRTALIALFAGLVGCQHTQLIYYDPTSPDNNSANPKAVPLLAVNPEKVLEEVQKKKVDSSK